MRSAISSVASPPVLRREGVERENFDAVIGGRLQRAPDRFGAGAMAGDARQPALLRPAAVAVHDDGDVARDGSAVGWRQPVSSLGRGAATSLAEDFLFLGLGGVVDLLDRIVGQLLHLVLEPLALVLADLVLLLVVS